MDISELCAIAIQSTEFIVEHMEDMPLICLKYYQVLDIEHRLRAAGLAYAAASRVQVPSKRGGHRAGLCFT